MSEWLIWGVLLVLQNASHTATSRSRNSNSLWYTAIASVFSNGIWFASQFYIFQMFLRVKGDPLQLGVVLVFYITLTAAGSTSSQWFLTRWEKRRGILKG